MVGWWEAYWPGFLRQKQNEIMREASESTLWIEWPTSQSPVVSEDDKGLKAPPSYYRLCRLTFWAFERTGCPSFNPLIIASSIQSRVLEVGFAMADLGFNPLIMASSIQSQSRWNSRLSYKRPFQSANNRVFISEQRFECYMRQRRGMTMFQSANDRVFIPRTERYKSQEPQFGVSIR